MCVYREYFGEKVALYYLWLGWYTFLLVPASLCFLGHPNHRQWVADTLEVLFVRAATES